MNENVADVKHVYSYVALNKMFWVLIFF